MNPGFRYLRISLLPLLLSCLVAVPCPLHAKAQADNREDIGDRVHLKYTPKDFVESLELRPRFPSAEDEKGTRQYNVFLRTIPAQKYFVGNEPLQITYEVYIPFDVRISNLALSGELKPFVLVSLHSGGRTSATNLNKYEKQRLVLTVRLPGARTYGIYELPPLDLSYEYEKAAGDKLVTFKNVLRSKPVELQKVPLYVVLVQEHDTCLIGDAVSFSIEIHADSTAEVLNEYPPEGSGDNAAYLSEYRPEEPFVLIDMSRQEVHAGSYRVIRWVYTVSPHDLQDEALSLAPPQIMWRKSARPSVTAESQPPPEIGVHAVIPEAISLKVLGITAGHYAFKPVKIIRREPDNERLWLSAVPRAAVWVLLVSAGALALSYISQIIKGRKDKAFKSLDSEPYQRERLNYDRWLYIRFLSKSRLQKAWEEFQSRPGKESCTELRSLLARRAAFRYAERRVSVQEACAMTATELRRLVGEVPEAGIISELDRQLETGQFASFSDGAELDNVI